MGILGSMSEERQRHRQIIGQSKLGLVLRVHQTPSALRLSARPDPLLLYVVLGTASVAGFAWAVASSLEVSAHGLLVLALLFSPVISLLALQNLRVHSSCVLDRERDVLEIEEQSFLRRTTKRLPLRDVEAIAVRALPGPPLLGSVASFGLYVVMKDAEYLAASSNHEAALSRDGWRVARFLGVPLETPMGLPPPAQHRASLGLIVTAAALYLVPTVLTLSALVVLFERLPGVEPSALVLVGAIIVSQLGAILSFAYYRARRPH